MFGGWGTHFVAGPPSVENNCIRPCLLASGKGERGSAALDAWQSLSATHEHFQDYRRQREHRRQVNEHGCHREPGCEAVWQSPSELGAHHSWDGIMSLSDAKCKGNDRGYYYEQGFKTQRWLGAAGYERGKELVGGRWSKGKERRSCEESELQLLIFTLSLCLEFIGWD